MDCLISQLASLSRSGTAEWGSSGASASFVRGSIRFIVINLVQSAERAVALKNHCGHPRAMDQEGYLTSDIEPRCPGLGVGISPHRALAHPFGALHN